MEKAAGHILKSDSVKLEGRFHLDVGRDDALNSSNKRNVTLASAQVRIVENHSEFAVMEVICGCGAKIRIRCEYTDAQSTEQGLDQKNNGENNNAN
jgi:hypothetical protein